VSRELKLLTWCDGDHDEDVVATVVRTLTVDGSKPVLLDLCDVCDKVVQDMIEFMERGVLASKAIATPVARVKKPDALPHRAVPEQVVPTRADGKDRVDCPECDYVGRTRSALGQHLTSKHGKKFSDFDWTPA
jgi:uncharacterized C2H2 Zn-finger protein